MPPFPKPRFKFEYVLQDEISALRNYKNTVPGRTVPRRESENLLVASWGLHELGVQGRTEDDVALIAEIASWFDVILIQGVATGLQGLDMLVERLGGKYQYLAPDARSAHSGLAIVYDSSTLEFTGEVGPVTVPASELKNLKLGTTQFKGFETGPQFATFRRGTANVSLVNVNLSQGSNRSTDVARRTVEAYALARWADQRSRSDPTSVVIAAGRFNLPKATAGDRSYDALVSLGLQIPPHSATVGAAIASDDNYETCAFFPKGASDRFTGASNVFDFDGAVFKKLWETRGGTDFRSFVRYHLSDARPAWYQLHVPAPAAKRRSTGARDVKRRASAKQRDQAVDAATGRPEARATSDRWTITDELGYDVYADALADFIQNPNTPTPLAISIKGEWGSGKTSLMRMVRKRIDTLSPKGEDPEPNGPLPGRGSKDGRPSNRAVLEELEKPPQDRNLLEDGAQPTAPEPTGESEAPTAPEPPPESEQAEKPRRTDLPTIWFNAWIYQSSRQLWAGLAVAIINGVASRMSFRERERFWLTLQIRRADGAALRRRLYRELVQRLLPKVFTLLLVSLAALAVWALHGVLALPTPATAVAGVAFLVPLLATPLYAWLTRGKFLEEGLDAAFSDLVREPDYANETGFLHLFHRDMRLILEAAGVSEEKPLVIFVDDLDRCSFGTVAEVVEGLNLFLAGQFPHCIFVIGMEPTLVAAQLGVANKDLFATLSGDDSAAARITYGWKFLEKMVQLPVALPAPRASRLERYVSSLTGRPPEGDGAAPEPLEQADEAEIERREQALVEELERRGGGISEVADAARTVDAANRPAASDQEPSADRPVDSSTVAAARRVVSRRANEDDPTVREMYRDYAGQLSGNPREFKRFLNVFRFYANLQITRELSPFPAPSLEQVGKITMLAVRWPNLIRDLTTSSGDGTAVASLEKLARDHRTVNAWTTAAKKKGLPDATCAALLRGDIHVFLRRGPLIADYADEFL
jgi:hypothetical protein